MPSLLKDKVRPMTRTMVDLDDDLVDQAREFLGTSSKRETVHAALREVVRQRLAERYMDWLATNPLPDLTDPAVMGGAWR